MELPARFGRYVLEERLGKGGMAEVFRARLDEAGFRKAVCIKRILPDLAGMPGFADMLRDEASLAARLSHQNLVQALDFGEIEGTLYLAMELVEGTTLGAVMKLSAAVQEPITVARALHIAVCMCRGLHYAHSATSEGKPLHFVHRDVSPHNVLLAVDGAVKIADFGIARASERITRTQTGSIKGKPQYMAPEQALAEECDHRVDQFATGIVLWEMLAGRSLFTGKGVMGLLDAVAACVVPPLAGERADVSPELDAILQRALSRKPDARYPSSLALERALDAELQRMGASLADVDLRSLVAETLPAAPRTDADTFAVEPTVDDMTAPSLAPATAPMRLPAPPVPAAPQSAIDMLRVEPLATPQQRRRLPPTWFAAGSIGLAFASVLFVVNRTGPDDPPAPTSVPAPDVPVIGVVLPPASAPTSVVGPTSEHDKPADVAGAPLSLSPPAPPEGKIETQGVKHVDVERFMAQARAAAARGDCAAAVKLAADVDDLAPDCPDAQKLLGSCLWKLKRTDAAVSHYRRYLTLVPNAPDAASVKRIIAEWTLAGGR